MEKKLNIFDKALKQLSNSNQKLILNIIEDYKKEVLHDDSKFYEKLLSTRDKLKNKFEMIQSTSMFARYTKKSDIDITINHDLYSAYLKIFDNDKVIEITLNKNIEIDIVKNISLKNKQGELKEVNLIIRKIITNQLIEPGPIIAIKEPSDINLRKLEESYFLKYSFLSNSIHADSTFNDYFKGVGRNVDSYNKLIKDVFSLVLDCSPKEVKDFVLLTYDKKTNPQLDTIINTLDSMIRKPAGIKYEYI